MKNLDNLPKETLVGMLKDFAKNWLAHDGLWFLEVEKTLGMDLAIEADKNAWKIFTKIEAKRIIKRHNIPENGGLDALKKALGFRMYTFLNQQEIIEEMKSSFVFRMNNCRVQHARKRKRLPDFPCKPVGIVEYSEFAKTIDPRIKTICIACPPDEHSYQFYCAWKFEI